ncbi:hypothetical protein AGMMS49921_12790 [Endomicrobiia bacterium]|nr:hypothetical protein AGMMS49921_12790 [Endomicrobiia bacterium]
MNMNNRSPRPLSPNLDNTTSRPPRRPQTAHYKSLIDILSDLDRDSADRRNLIDELLPFSSTTVPNVSVNYSNNKTINNNAQSSKHRQQKKDEVKEKEKKAEDKEEEKEEENKPQEKIAIFITTFEIIRLTTSPRLCRPLRFLK